MESKFKPAGGQSAPARSPVGAGRRQRRGAHLPSPDGNRRCFSGLTLWPQPPSEGTQTPRSLHRQRPPSRSLHIPTAVLAAPPRTTQGTLRPPETVTGACGVPVLCTASPTPLFTLKYPHLPCF